MDRLKIFVHPQLSGFIPQEVILIYSPEPGYDMPLAAQSRRSAFPMLAGRVMPGSRCRGLACQCPGFILLLKGKAVGHLPSNTGYQSNSLLCPKALVHGPAC